MTLDLALLAVLALFALNGSYEGLVEQVTHWSALAVGYFAAWPAAAKVAPTLAPRLRVSPFGVEVSVAAVLYLAFYAVGALSVQWLIRKAVGAAEGSAWNRWGGALLGALKGGVVVYASLSLLLFFEAPLTKALGQPPAAARTSRVVGLVRGHNLFPIAPAAVAAARRK